MPGFHVADADRNLFLSDHAQPPGFFIAYSCHRNLDFLAGRELCIIGAPDARKLPDNTRPVLFAAASRISVFRSGKADDVRFMPEMRIRRGTAETFLAVKHG